MAEEKIAETPLMKQYNSIKAKYPDALLLFRVGDFYETFSSDAIKTAKILGIVLTKRANGSARFVELAGFPHHALDTYLPKLVKAGQRVAICDQLEDPKTTKTIVKRGVTELVTPGVSYNDNVLEHKVNNFLASVDFNAKVSGVSFLDISTGEFFVAQGSTAYIDKLLQSFRPNEVIVQRNKLAEFNKTFGDKFFTTTFDDWVFTSEFGSDILLKHFDTLSFKGFGVEHLQQGIVAAGAVLHYLNETQHHKVGHINKLSRIEEDHYVWLDRFTIRNLELLHSPNENAKTLLQVIDKTVSPMGSRMLKRWMVLPLKDIQPIKERHNVVEYFVKNSSLRDKLISEINNLGDLERLISKVSTGKVNPRETLQLKRALYHIEFIQNALAESKEENLQKMAEQLNFCALIRQKIEKELQIDAPVVVAKGGVIAEGVSGELDELRNISTSSKDILKDIQQRESQNTGISSLKIGYNNVFGYYLEVTNVHKDKVPEEWHRKQTLTGSERYITEELKILESKILGAGEKILGLEHQLYSDLILSLIDYIIPIQTNAAISAKLDVLLAFASLANEYNYIRPEVNNSYVLDIKNGRHPVIEQQLEPGESYVANNVYLDTEKQQIIIITGPNMSGKSALLRQTALIVLLAQMGSFVPAESSKIGLIDKLFTRVGASDNISSGESTFMVEMNETASILNNISNRSLILLDEIGRGTSTYDGISIAWSIAEYLHEHPAFKAKVLFATHYHELNEMAKFFKRIKNYHISVKEIQNKIIFLRKLEKGGSEHSFGIHVAKMAGIPQSIVDRSNEMLLKLEEAHRKGDFSKSDKKKNSVQNTDDFQLSFIQLDDPLLYQIRDDILSTDINTLTPVEALMKLNEIKNLLGK
ncbi:MAG: DNA mismatch repair protein MutS [Bacteroidales bacterium]|jgi:DNA mismatch repair protein MutS|nr:DNA mismatch repair protein MutS [Bacteroidales bacterium]